jgi:putative transcriptional regulator
VAHRSVVARFGSRLKSLRREAGLTQGELAERAELAVETISRMENGHWSNTTIEVAERLAQALGVSMVALFEPIASTPKSGLRSGEKRVLALISGLADDQLADVHRALQLLLDVRVRRGRRRRKSAPR